MSSAHFTSAACSGVSLSSSWFGLKSTSVADTQTDDQLWAFSESETQCGVDTFTEQHQVASKYDGFDLLAYLRKVGTAPDVEWESAIAAGRVTVDCEVVTTPETKLERDYFVEFVDYQRDAGTQTSLTHTREEEEEKGGEREWAGIDKFLRKVAPMVELELDLNLTSKAFDSIGAEEIAAHAGSDNEYWRCLSVDLERAGVVYPDWSRGTHHLGIITRCSVTRTRERVYDIEFEDGAKLFVVREEHIRVRAGDDKELEVRRRDKGRGNAGLARYTEDMRVHVRVAGKRDGAKYLPGRIRRVGASNSYDVDCEGGRTEVGVAFEDLLCGLEEGMGVEARRPHLTQLQCAGLSWSCTGSSLAAAFGQKDSTAGWGVTPGVVCVWALFGRKFDAEKPDAVLDHTSSLNCVAFHPEQPSTLAGGSFDGEIILWDLSSDAPEQAVCISAISELSSKAPISSVQWTYHADTGDYLISSVSADGRVLFWSRANKLKAPVYGSLLGRSRAKGYPSAHGGKCLAFSGAAAGKRVAQWALAGLEGGAVVRSAVGKLLSGQAANEDSAYPPFRRRDDEAFSFEAHIGGVASLQFSPFHRSLFLSAGDDGVAKLFHILEGRPLLQWEPAFRVNATEGIVGLTSAAFSFTRPTVFAVGAMDGCVYIYDLAATTTAPVLVLEPPRPTHASTGRGSSKRHHPITGVAFNSKQRDMLAACDEAGRVHVWRLGWSLCAKRPEDQRLLDKLASSPENN